MSSRYSICATAAQLEERFSVEVSAGYVPNYNAAPGQLLPVITNTGPQGLSFFYWGLAPQWANNKPISEKIIHVRAEQIADKASYRKTLSRQRCIVPADGVYEWKKVGKKTAIPYRYRRFDKMLFSFAGMWEEYEDNEENFHTFTILTLPAGEAMQALGERVPVILTPEKEKLWLSNTGSEADWLDTVKTSEFSGLDNYSISPRINSLTANDAGLIAPTPPTDQFGNLTLFD